MRKKNGFLIILISGIIILTTGFISYFETIINSNMLYRSRYLLIGVGFFLIVGTLWIAALNYLVQSRTKALTEANLQLNQTQSQNKAIINANPDAIFLLDNDTRVQLYKIEGLDDLFHVQTDLLMRKLSDLLPPPYGMTLIDTIDKLTAVNALSRLEFDINVESMRKIYEMRVIRSNSNEVIVFLRDMTTHYENIESIKFLSYHDQLTGLFNRHMFEAELKRLDVKRNFPLSIIMGDVNGLKLINDCFGHPVGDQLLIKLSELLKRFFREDDIICRLGGDEFIIILPKTSYEVANDLIGRIGSACEATEFYYLNLSVSFGCATKRDTSDTIIDVMKYAEDQMYKRKLIEGPKVKALMIHKLLESLFESSATETKHAETVEIYSEMLGDALGLSATEIDTLKLSAKFHDIGKIALDQKLLHKREALTTVEMEAIRSHPDIGYRILSVSSDFLECAEIVLAHHERWDGKGYPKGLVGEAIPLMSRIIALTDSYCTMTQVSYHNNLIPPESALVELEKHFGSQFDPVLGQKFVTLIKDKM